MEKHFVSLLQESLLFCGYICSYYNVAGNEGLLGRVQEWRKKNQEYIIHMQKE